MGAEVTILDIDTAHRVPSQSHRGSASEQSRESGKGQGSENERGWESLVKERKNVILLQGKPLATYKKHERL